MKKNNAIFYDIYKSYEDNFKTPPSAIKKLKKLSFGKTKQKYKFLGFPVNLPFGMPAGPVINSKYVKKAFDLGFFVSTYKTVRGEEYPCHPYPNVLFIKTSSTHNPQKNLSVTLDAKVQIYPNITVTNSFGVPSKTPAFWQKDFKKALRYEKKGTLLILSFMGTVKKNQTQDELIKDFAKTAKLAKQTNAKVLEVNLSCPNIGNEGLVCYNLNATERVCSAIRKAIGNTPLIIKVGYYSSDKDIEKIAKIADKYANAIAVINTIQAEILDKKGKQAIPGNNRLRSGICGKAIKWAGIEMVKKLNKIRKNKGYKYEIVGIGGVLMPKDYREYRKAGADLVQSATGAMWNPNLAYEIYKGEINK